jgi:hypothetical protein
MASAAARMAAKGSVSSSENVLASKRKRASIAEESPALVPFRVSDIGCRVTVHVSSEQFG